MDNWRGDYHMGTFGTGETGRCAKVPQDETDHETGGTQTGTGGVELYWTYCLAGMQWPGKYIWLDHSVRAAPPGNPDTWIGGLVHNKRDLTGNLYMRNRYYDPAAGRFTQEDPIGLAGGLNAYGFAAGDPVSYSDPYGLCPPVDTDVSTCGSDKLGRTWKALDSSGQVGKDVIKGVVDRGTTVSFGNTRRECGSTRGCFNPEANSITLNNSLRPGAAAVALAHEAGGHLTETKALTVAEGAQNEIRAWTIHTAVYDGLTGSARSQAENAFKTEIDFFKANPETVYNQFLRQYQRRSPGSP